MLIFLVIIFAVYVAILALVAWISIHPPRFPVLFDAAVLKYATERVEIESEGRHLGGQWILPENPGAVCVLSHGYMMNRCELYPIGTRLAQEGVAILGFDYRSHGDSPRGPVGIGTKEWPDLVEAARLARVRFPNLPLVIYGSSMGAACAAIALEKHPDLADGVVFDSVYQHLGRSTIGWWEFLGGKVLKAVLAPTVYVGIVLTGFNPFRTNLLSTFKALPPIPKLFLHGEADTVAPVGDIKAVAAVTTGSVKFISYPGCQHCGFRTVFAADFATEVVQFFEIVAKSYRSRSGHPQLNV